MVFSSTIFLFVFLPTVLVLYYNPFFKGRSFRNMLLLMASLVFYAWGEPVFVFLMIFSVFVTWLLGEGMQKSHARLWLAVGVVYHVTLLFLFKYLSFFAAQAGALLNLDFFEIELPLPIGISFYTFQLMSYLFDVYRQRAQVQKNPFYLGLYTACFPQLIAGPIVRYEKIAASITDRRETFDDVVTGMKRFIYGLGKKVLLSNYVAQIADSMFVRAGSLPAVMAWLGAISYTFQIYFDFSGYSDMAIGLGRMFGFHFDENFDYPYLSKSVTEFWRRWHISLGTWFRDYVYIPLGGNRVKRARHIFNLLFVWLLTGLWHGANWTFLAWGLMYFAFLLLEKVTGLAEKPRIFSRVYTMLVVIFAWVIFRSDSIHDAALFIGNMFGAFSGRLIDPTFFTIVRAAGLVLAACAVGCVPFLKHIFAWLAERRLAWVESVWILAVFLLSVLQVINASYQPFVYFNF